MLSRDGQRYNHVASAPDWQSDAIWHRSFPWQNSDIAARSGASFAHDVADRSNYHDGAVDFLAADVAHAPDQPGTLYQSNWPEIDLDEPDQGDSTGAAIGTPRAWMGSVHRRPKAATAHIAKIGLGAATLVAFLAYLMMLGSADRTKVSDRPAPHLAELVAQGLSNPDIASELVLSRATVQTHVSHILSKLQVRSRVELIRTVALYSSEELPSAESKRSPVSRRRAPAAGPVTAVPGRGR